jgi:hypothetical protein
LLSSASLITFKPIIGYGRFAPCRKRTPGIPLNSVLPQLARNALAVRNTEQQEKGLDMNLPILLITVTRLFNFTKTHRTASSVVVLATLLFVFSAGTAMSRASKAGTPDTTSFSRESQQTSASTAARVKEKIGSESIAITRYGFEPREISRVGGRFFLSVENNSGVSPLVLRVTAQTGRALKEFTLTRDQLDWADEVNLPEGQYTVTEVNRGWTCRLTITTAP